MYAPTVGSKGTEYCLQVHKKMTITLKVNFTMKILKTSAVSLHTFNAFIF